MRNLIRDDWSICPAVRSRCSRGLIHGLLILPLPLASEAALAITGALPGSQEAYLSAQTAQTRQGEERLFLEARRALNREEYDRAAELFQKLRDDYAHGQLITDSYYWEAFGRYRQGDLLEAQMLLDVAWAYDEVRYGGRLQNDVRDLRLRVRRQLAERGDPRAAEEVLRESEALLVTDTARLGTTVGSTRSQRLQRVLADLRFRADSAIAVRRAMLRTDSLAREYALSRAHADSLAAAARLRTYMTSLVREQQAAVGALTDFLQGADTLGQADTTAAVAVRLSQVGSTLARTNAALRALTADPQALGAFRSVPPQVPDGCEDASIQQEAFTALLRLANDAIPSVRDVFAREDECSAHLRHQAVSWLARQGSAEAEATLIETAKSHPDTETRQWAVMGLAEYGTPKSAEILSQILGESQDDGIRSEVINALWHNPNEEATEALVAFVSDEREPERLREEAAAGLGLRVSPEPGPTMAVFEDVGPDRIRISLLQVMGRRAQAGEVAIANWLFEQSLNRELSLEVRKAAMEAWSRGSAANLERLVESYDQLEEPELRERVFYALYRHARSGARLAPVVVDRMIELARMETDPEVRERAVYWLGRTGSERAAEFLTELLRKPPDGFPVPGS